MKSRFALIAVFASLALIVGCSSSDDSDGAADGDVPIEEIVVDEEGDGDDGTDGDGPSWKDRDDWDVCEMISEEQVTEIFGEAVTSQEAYDDRDEPKAKCTWDLEDHDNVQLEVTGPSLGSAVYRMREPTNPEEWEAVEIGEEGRYKLFDESKPEKGVLELVAGDLSITARLHDSATSEIGEQTSDQLAELASEFLAQL